MSNKMDRPLVTVDGRTLMDRPLEPPNFVVDTLISQGLHILAGSPKVGKSWLALWLSVMVAKGEPVWGMSVKQGTTLYLCLEDSVLRIQNRLFEITEDAPDSVHFCTECAPIGQGLEEQVEGLPRSSPGYCSGSRRYAADGPPVHDATYANDYRDLSVLKRLADKHGIAILLIHHLRKETADDVFNRISGTTAISGAWIPVLLWWKIGAAAVRRSSPASVVTLNTGSCLWNATLKTMWEDGSRQQNAAGATGRPDHLSGL